MSVAVVRRAMSPLLALAALTISLLVATADGARADYDLGVTWPDVAAVNPATQAYEIDVVDSGPGTLYAVWNGDWQELPHTGRVALELPTDALGQRVSIYRCASGCEWAGVASPVLNVLRGIEVQVHAMRSVVTAPSSLPVYVSVTPTFVTGTSYTWRLLSDATPSAVELASSASAVPGGLLTVDIPAGLDDGTALLEVRATVDVGAGPVTDTAVVPLTVDVTAPVASLALTRDTVYPVPDDYQDLIRGLVLSDEQGRVKVRIRSLDGAVEGPWGGQTGLAPNRTAKPYPILELPDGYPPTGDYLFEALVTDLAGNRVLLTQPFRLSRARVTMVTWDRTYSAKETLARRFVGSCSSLVSPSSRGWAGSLGLNSGAKCARTSHNASLVLTTHAAWMPDAILHRYGTAVLSVYGGAARHHTGSRLVTGFVSRDDRLAGVLHPAAVGWHRSERVAIEHYLRRQDGRPFAVWFAAVGKGWRYDLRSFRIRFRYAALVEPGPPDPIPRAGLPEGTPQLASPPTPEPLP